MSLKRGNPISATDLQKSLGSDILLNPGEYEDLVQFINTPNKQLCPRIMMIIAMIAARKKDSDFVSLVNPFQRLELTQPLDDCFNLPWTDTMKLRQLSLQLNPLLSIPKPEQVTPDMRHSTQPQYEGHQTVVSQTLNMFPSCLDHIPKVDEFNLSVSIRTLYSPITHRALFDHILYIIDGFVALSQIPLVVESGSETPIVEEVVDMEEEEDEVRPRWSSGAPFMSKTPQLKSSALPEKLQQRLVALPTVRRRVFKVHLIGSNSMPDLKMKQLRYYTLLIEAIIHLRYHGNAAAAAYKFEKLYKLFVDLHRLIIDICVFLVGPEANGIKVYPDFTTHMTVNTKYKDYFWLIYKISRNLYIHRGTTNRAIIEFLVRSLLFLLPPADIQNVVDCIVVLSRPDITHGDAHQYITSDPGRRRALVRIFNLSDFHRILNDIDINESSSSSGSSLSSSQGGTPRRNHKRSNKKYKRRTLKPRFSKNKQTKTRKVNRSRK